MWTIRYRPSTPSARTSPSARCASPSSARAAAEDLIDEDDYARDERLPYWAELWPSAHVLAERLGGRDPPAGAGWSSWAAASACRRSSPPSAGPTSLATDWYPEALAFARANAAAAGRPRRDACRWTGPTARALFARGPGRPRRGRRRALRGAQRRPPWPPSSPACSRPAARPLIADPRRPHAAGPARAAPSGRLVATSADDVRHAGAARRVGSRRPSAPARRPGA